MNPNGRDSWQEFLNPEITRPRLIAASIYIAAFEALEQAIVGRIRDFFCSGFDEQDDTIGPKYQSDVLARNRSPVYASLDWLKENNAVDIADLQSFERVKGLRNTLSHNLFSLLGNEGLPADFDERFGEMVELLRKIEVWWIANVEVATDPDYSGVDIDGASIHPARVILIKLLCDIALGDEAQSRFYYNEFRKQTRRG